MNGIVGRLLFSWIANAIAIGVAVALIGSIDTTGVGANVLASLVFGIVNLLVKPILTLLTLPLVVISWLVDLILNLVWSRADVATA
jgi:putative membrane protein